MVVNAPDGTSKSGKLYFTVGGGPESIKETAVDPSLFLAMTEAESEVAEAAQALGLDTSLRSNSWEPITTLRSPAEGRCEKTPRHPMVAGDPTSDGPGVPKTDRLQNDAATRSESDGRRVTRG